MKHHYSKVLLAIGVAFTFFGQSVFAQSSASVPSTSMWALIDDPKIIAALVAAAVTLFVNVVGKLFLDRRLERFKAELAKKETENEARIQYEMDAKKRLYAAVGNLRFQLLLSSRDVAHHIISAASAERRYPTTTTNYYGQSTIYKLVRPLALCELIENQISVADFSVDPDSVDLLRLKGAIYAAFSSGRPILQHPDANWEKQEQHIFYNSLSRISNSIVMKDDAGARSIMAFHEFEKFILAPENSEKMAPLPRLLEDFDIQEKPLLWLRFVLFGFLCSEIVNKKGGPIGFEKIDYLSVVRVFGTIGRVI